MVHTVTLVHTIAMEVPLNDAIQCGIENVHTKPQVHAAFAEVEADQEDVLWIKQ